MNNLQDDFKFRVRDGKRFFNDDLFNKDISLKTTRTIFYDTSVYLVIFK